MITVCVWVGVCVRAGVRSRFNVPAACCRSAQSHRHAAFAGRTGGTQTV